MYISVIPALKMPFGHCFFDYEISSGTVHVGDVILVPFRNRKIAALVAKKSTESEWAGRVIKISDPQKIVKLPESVPEFCVEAAAESFVSPPTMLNAWFRTVPKRQPKEETHTPVRDTHLPKDADKTEARYLLNRYTDPSGIVPTVLKNQANGRILVLTPWQRRADYLAAKLNCPVLHADLSYGAAWKAWTGFLNQSHGVLVTTRLGAWLSGIADIVIMDEPENDDYKQDELTPRYDVRNLVTLARQSNPALRLIEIGTTPNLAQFHENNLLKAPIIEPDVEFARFDSKNRSSIEMLTLSAFNALEDADKAGRPIRILHTVIGTRGRIRCADCNWTMECDDCAIGLHNMQDHALCRRCNTKKSLPYDCPKCHSTNLSKAVIGSDGLQRSCKQHFPNADLKVLDLHEWLKQALRPGTLLIATNVAYISGFAEDIRRQERLVLSLRRLAAQACVAKCRLIVQGAAPLIDTCPSWLTPEGVSKTWELELADRKVFGYPPAARLAKLIVMGKIEDADVVKSKLQTICEAQPSWKFRGPYPVEYWSKTREPRCIFHIFPPSEIPKQELIDELSVLTAYGILDLDPIAFFC
jgi:primosomal protein N'